MKTLFLFPPQWTPISPHFAIPSLMGQLKGHGFEADVMDLNIEFYNKILDKSYLVQAIDKAFNGQENLLKEIALHHSPDKKVSDYSEDIQSKMIKYSKIKEYKTNKTYQTANIPDFVEDAKKILKSKTDYYKPELLIKAVNIIDTALDIASMPYFPSKITFESYTNPFFKLNYESIKKYVFDRSTNMYWDYFELILPEIKAKNAAYIGIAINSSSQIVAGLSLAHILKTNLPEAHINIGGNFFGRVADKLCDNYEFFELFCHSVMVEEGEMPVIELAKYVDGQIEIENVPNLIYFKDGQIKTTPKASAQTLDKMKNVNLDGFKFDAYFAPEIVMPFQTSKGCYWGKCSFCDQDFGQNFNVKNVDKLVSEIKELKNKYNISKFEFIDESVSPSYLKEMAQKFIEENLDISYFNNARLETAFSKDILELGAKSGLKMLLWGLESGSDAVMELINKGIDIRRRFDILRDSKDAGIWNFAFIFFGFPTETFEDAVSTINMIADNTDIIHSYGRSVFTMGKHTKLRQDPQHYGIIGVSEAQDELSPSFEFESTGMSKQELSDAIKLCTKSCNEAYDNPLWMYLRYREFLFLYIDHYGIDWVQDYKFNA